MVIFVKLMSYVIGRKDFNAKASTPRPIAGANRRFQSHLCKKNFGGLLRKMHITGILKDF
jgi:hypothetical protein